MTFPVPSMLEARVALPLFEAEFDKQGFYTKTRTLRMWAEIGDQFLLMKVTPMGGQEYRFWLLSSTGIHCALYHWSDETAFTATFDGVVKEDDYERFKVTPV